ncbi:hypothetical protein MTR_3g084670 [Medicago truncatula]|uniref:RING-type E3 ubiquitin transferase n=1 Tax=Medicago truncatula TaxID=3880 RepID=G7JBB4_MEDTR|nr:hypothetical protein MTR_3g084670 [Medicago truncatula]
MIHHHPILCDKDKKKTQKIKPSPTHLTPPSLILISSSSSSLFNHTGVKKKVLLSLPKLTATEEYTVKFYCAVCLSEFSAGDEIRVLPQCGHGFNSRSKVVVTFTCYLYPPFSLDMLPAILKLKTQMLFVDSVLLLLCCC